MEREGESLRLATRIGMAFADGYGLSTEFRDYHARLRGSSLAEERVSFNRRALEEALRHTPADSPNRALLEALLAEEG